MKIIRISLNKAKVEKLLDKSDEKRWQGILIEEGVFYITDGRVLIKMKIDQNIPQQILSDIKPKEDIILPIWIDIEKIRTALKNIPKKTDYDYQHLYIHQDNQNIIISVYDKNLNRIDIKQKWEENGKGLRYYPSKENIDDKLSFKGVKATFSLTITELKKMMNVIEKIAKYGNNGITFFLDEEGIVLKFAFSINTKEIGIGATSILHPEHNITEDKYNKFLKEDKKRG